MARVASWVKALCEYLGGERDGPPSGVPVGLGSPLWGVWWAVLATVLYAFSGQTSKFIYIDF